MKFNIDPYISIGRSSVIWVAGGITGLGLSQYADPAALTEGFNHIFNGAKEIWDGVWILIPAGVASYAAWQKRNINKAQAASNVPGVTVLVHDDAAHDLKQAAADPTQPNIKPVHP